MPQSISSLVLARFWDARHNRAVRNVANVRDQVLADFSLTSAEWFVLDVAHAAKATGISVGEVARTMDVQTTYIALVLRHLQAKQLVTTTADKHDRRVHLVRLTAAGEKALARSEAALVRTFLAWTKGLDSQDFAAYSRVASVLSLPAED